MLSKGFVLLNQGQRYRISDELSAKKNGGTYQAIRESDGRKVAIKIILLAGQPDWSNYNLLEREIAIIKNLQNSHIPQYLDHFPVGDTANPDGLALVHEFIDGKSLTEYIENPIPLPESAIMDWFCQILSVCAYIHELHPPLIHQNISPDNILLDQNKHAYLINFGKAKLQSDNALSDISSDVYESYSLYTPPEQVFGMAHPASDIFSLAMTCLAVASHKTPEVFPRSNEKVMIPDLVHLSPIFTTVLKAMTDPDFKRRPQTAREILKKLTKWEDNTDIRSVNTQTNIPNSNYNKLNYNRENKNKNKINKNDNDNTPKKWPLPSRNLDQEGIYTYGLSASGNVLFLENYIIDTHSLEIVDVLPDDKHRKLFIKSITPRGETLGAFVNNSIPIHFYSFNGNEYRKKSTINDSGIKRLDEITLSPNGRLVILMDNGNLYLYDVKTGNRIQDIFVAETLDTTMHAFSPDGSMIVYHLMGTTHILTQDGKKMRLKGTEGIAFSPGGDLAAVFYRQYIEFKKISNLFDKEFISRVNIQDIYSHSYGCFSRDSRKFLFYDRDKKQVQLIDVLSGEILYTCLDTIDSHKKMENYASPGFTSDANRFMLFTQATPNKYFNPDKSHDINVQIYRTSDSRYLGALAKRKKRLPDNLGLPQYKSEFILLSEAGFYWPLVQPPQEPLQKEKKTWVKTFINKLFIINMFRNKDNKDTKDTQSDDPWLREFCKDLLIGQPVELLLSNEERDQITDIEFRWDFFKQMINDKKLAKDADIIGLVKKSFRLSYMLDMVFHQAYQIQADKTSYGVKKGKATISGNIMKSALSYYNKMSDAQLAGAYYDYCSNIASFDITAQSF